MVARSIRPSSFDYEVALATSTQDDNGDPATSTRDDNDGLAASTQDDIIIAMTN
jgi:hypothetical protein